jgi:iron complex outermembrane receptor protein
MLTASISHQYDNLSGSVKIYTNRGEGNLYNDRPTSGGWGTFLNDFDMSGVHLKEQLSPWTGSTVLAGLDIDKISGKVNGPHTGQIMPWDTGFITINMPNFRVTSPYLAMSQEFKLTDVWSVVPSAGIRYYNHSEYDSKSAPHAGLSVVSEKATIFANVSKGINYPGIEGPALQAALPFLFNGSTWQNLSPEELNHKEIGLKLAPSSTTQVDISLFRDDIKNRYIYDLSLNTAPTPFNQTVYQNLGGYHTVGAELSVKQKLGQDWTAFGGLTLLDPSINNLPYTPKTAFTAGLNGNVGVVKIAVDAQYQSQVFALNQDRNIANPNTQKVASFTVVNLRGSYPLPALGKKGEVFLAVENLLDEKYEYRPGYAMPGISGQLGVSASF